jgi:hypothetical protein
MCYQPRIIADPNYLLLLGQTLYNFTYLEWIVIWVIAKLNEDGLAGIPKSEPSAEIAKALTQAVVTAGPRLTAALRRDVARFDARFRTAIRTRNDLFHAHPFTTDQAVRDGAREYEWPRPVLGAAAKLFEDVAIEGDDLLHNGLSKL